MKKTIIKGLLLATGFVTINATTQGMPNLPILSTDNPVITESFAKVESIGNLRFRLIFLNPNQKKTSITIYDDKGNLVFDDYVGSEKQYMKIFDLSNLSDGQVVFKVDNVEKSFQKEFEIFTESNRLVTTINK
ncbi:MAG: hypothetical protein ACRCVT_15065 [Leadbetterella sp.]